MAFRFSGFGAAGAAICAAALAQAPLWAQATGTITGTVRDVSGSVVAGAKVTATEVNTNLSRHVTSNMSGEYAFPFLPVGQYGVKAEKEGFTAMVQNGIALDANRQVAADFILRVGSVTTEVTVSGSGNLVQTDSTSLVQIVDSQRIEDLPLNGRDILELISLSAGVSDVGVPVTYQGSNLGFGAYQPAVSIQGSRGTSGNYLLDNTDYNEAQTNQPQPYPNPDALQEFSLQSSSFDARYGRAGGGVVNAVTKSGTNQFHGGAFDFLRNFALNSRNFFAKSRDTLRRNQFGGTLGGPIRKDRTFFFVSYQATPRTTANPARLLSVPTAAMKNGDFSAWLQSAAKGAVIDPLSGNPFPNNNIPQAQINPVSAKIFGMIPTGQNGQTSTYVSTPTTTVNDQQLMLHLDELLSERNHLSGRYFMFYYDAPPLLVPDDLLISHDGQHGVLSSISLGDTYTISPSWLNVLNVSYTTEAPDRLTTSSPNVNLQTLGANVKDVPDINLLDIGITGWTGISLGNAAHNWSRSLDILDTISHSNGRHDLYFGIDARRYRTGFRSYFLTDGTVSFTGQMQSVPGKTDPGNAYADFVLGVAASWRQLSVSRLSYVYNPLSLFVQDNVRVTPKLTANLGLRWDAKPSPHDAGDHQTTFLAGQQSAVFPNAPLGLVFSGDPALQGENVIRSRWKNLAPRLGLAYRLTSSTVLRAAYGVFWDELKGLDLNRTIQGQPWAVDETINGGVLYSNPYAGRPVLDPVNFAPSHNMAFTSYGTYSLPATDMRSAYVQSWNVILERQIPYGILLRGAYVGSKGTHLRDALENNAAIYGPGASAKNIDQRRPYAGIGSLLLASPIGNSSYNSLQVTAQKRYAHGFSILANYTVSKSIDDTSNETVAPDPLNIRNDRGPSAFDIPERLVVSGLWHVPAPFRRSRLSRSLLGGWETSGIFVARKGTPLTIVSGIDNNYDGVNGDFARYLGGDVYVSGDRTKHQEITQWFNTKAFGVEAPGTLGSSRRGWIRAPGAWNVDFGLIRYFSLTERARLQFRGEFFNLFNHANLSSPDTSASSPSFGHISGASSPRIVQLALKINF